MKTDEEKAVYKIQYLFRMKMPNKQTSEKPKKTSNERQLPQCDKMYL